MRWSQGQHNGACGIRNVFCLKCSQGCVYFSVLELLQAVTQGTRSAIGRLWVHAGYPNQETKWRWSDHRSHQRRYPIFSTHLNDQRHILIHLYLTDRICKGKSFQILGFYSASMHVLLFVFKTQGDVWGKLVNYMVASLMSPVASLVTTGRCSNVSMCLRISTKCFLFPGIVPLLYSVGNKTYYY